MFRTVIVTVLLLTATPAFAKLYKCTDADGNVVYTDEPCAGGEELKLPPLPTFSLPKPKKKVEPELPPDSKPEVKGYKTFEITQPKNDTTIHSVEGKVEIGLALTPSLKIEKGHKIQLKMNGKALGKPGETTRIQLNNLDRGSYAFQADIIDGKGVVIKSSNTVTIFIFKPSINFPNNPNNPANAN